MSDYTGEEVPRDLPPATRLEMKAARDQHMREVLGQGPGELTATYGFTMDWTDAMSKLRRWCSRYRQAGGLHVLERYRVEAATTFSEALGVLAATSARSWDQAQDRVPYDTGYLHSTGEYGILGTPGGEETDHEAFHRAAGEGSALAVARYTATYAAIVHEEPESKRVSGDRKWLEDAWLSGWAEFTRRMTRVSAQISSGPVTVVYIDPLHGRLRVEGGVTPRGAHFSIGRDIKGRFRSLRTANITFE